MAELKDIINTLDKAADAFDHIATAEQDKLYEDILLLAKQLDTDTQGKVKQSIANLKRLTQIRAKLAALSKDKEWAAGIAEFSKYFGLLQKQQNAYFSQHFPEHTLTETAKQKHNLMKQMAVQNTVEALMGDGLKANVTDKLNDILLRAVTGGAKFKDLQEELRVHLLGADGGHGALARYANTYAVTALSQFTGQNNKLLTDDIDTEWFMYTGSNIETTREFCQHLTEKKYIHKSEIPQIIKGKINDYQCAIYAKTGLPYGMIAGTTPENFQINCGGWNCRHQLVPVADAVVPKNEKDALPYRQSPDYIEVETNKNGGLKATHVKHNFDKKKGDYERISRDVGYQCGHSVILEAEPQNIAGKKSCEGLWDGLLFEVSGAENGTPNNVRNSLKHCAKKPKCEIAVLYFPNHYSVGAFEKGLGQFNGLKDTSQYKKFKKVICIHNNKVINEITLP